MGRVPVSCLMILHMTFALGTGISSAREAFGTYARAELREVFSGYAWVMDVVKAPHFVIDFRAKCSRNCKANSRWSKICQTSRIPRFSPRSNGPRSGCAYLSVMGTVAKPAFEILPISFI